MKRKTKIKLHEPVPVQDPFTTRAHQLVGEGTAARVLAVPASTLRFWRMQGEGPKFIKLGRSIRYRIADLETHIAAAERQQTTGAKRKTPTATAPTPEAK